MSSLTPWERLAWIQEGILDACTPEQAIELHMQAISVLLSLTQSFPVGGNLEGQVRSHYRAVQLLRGFNLQATPIVPSKRRI